MAAVSRFAPSTTGEAHPGTLLSGLLVWLDARSRGGQVFLRLEDLDHTRCRPDWARQMVDDLAWFGLEWDQVVHQSDRAHDHEAALERLAADGRLYPCTCSRRDRVGGRRAQDGGWVYPNHCRGRPLPPRGWRTTDHPLRVHLDDGPVSVLDENGRDLSQNPATDMGDPVVVRRDRVLAYQLVVVVDDAASGITRIVRGADIAPSTATQVALQRLLAYPTPVYRHHLLLLAPAGEKLAKLHGSAPASQLRSRYSGAELCGLLAHSVGMTERLTPCKPVDLIGAFDWSRIATSDLVATWNDRLVITPASATDR